MANAKHKVLRLWKDNEVVRNSLIYVISSVVNASIPFFLLPIMTSCLTPADYGITAMFQVVLSFLLPIVGLNSEGATGTEYFRKVFNDLPGYIGNALLLVSVSFIGCLLVGWVFVGSLSRLLELSKGWVMLAIVQTFFQFLTWYLLALWQVSKQPVKYGIFQIAMSALNAGLSIWLVYGLHWGYVGRLTGNLTAVVVFGIVALVYLFIHYKVRLRYNRQMARDILHYGVPLIPHALGGWAMALIDRVFLADMIGLDSVGLYSVAFQLASVFGFLTIAINQAFSPWLYGQLTEDNSLHNKVRIVRFSYVIMVALVVCAGIYVVLMPIIKHVFINERYHNITPMFVVLLCGFVFQGFYFMFTNYISYIKKTKYQAVVTLIVAGVKFPVTYFLISCLGAMGAAWSYAVIYFLFFVLTAIVSSKLYPMPWISFCKA